MPARDPILLERAKAMRSGMAGPEARLWHHLRAKRLNGVKFARQVVLGSYVVDFAARMNGLVIELDGDSHAETVRYDEQRTEYLSSKGYRVIRFSNADVMGNMDGVLQAILAELDSAPLPGPLPVGEREK